MLPKRKKRNVREPRYVAGFWTTCGKKPLIPRAKSIILTATGEPFLAIDPKGIVGAKGYDVGTYLLNPVQAKAENLVALAPQRLEILSEMIELNQQELAMWGFVHAVVSACWDTDIHGDWDVRALAVARGLERYL